METKRKFVVACGGTGGHVFPGLAVANKLRERGHDVTVWLSGRSIESSTLCSWDGPVFYTKATRLSARNALAILRSIWRCRRQMYRDRPDALLAMGSYASLPPVIGARWTGVPIILHEANAVPGKANEMLARLAQKVAISFDCTAKYFPRTPSVTTGLPIRGGLDGQQPYDDLPRDKFTFFVTGGSQGAHRVNELTSQAFELLARDQDIPFNVIHQCGRDDEAWLKEHYAKHNVNAKVSAFIPDMGRAFASADFVISRAGASTCFELCALGKPALLIPLPSAIRNHQHLNAQALVEAGGADEAIQAEMTGRSLMRYLANKLKDRTSLQQMATAIRKCAVPDAADRVCDAIEAMVQK